MNSNAQTDREMFWVMKYFLPLLLFAGVGALLVRNYSTASAVINRLPLEAPFLLWGIFLLAVGEVRATDNRLEFRRFYKWRQIPYAAIRQCARSLHPGLGFIQLNEFWSRIYFVTLRPTFDHSCDVLAYINERCLGPHVPNAPHPHKAYHGAQRSSIKSIRLCLMMFLVGIIYSIFLTVSFPNLFSESN
jgi:hypothetical protein